MTDRRNIEAASDEATYERRDVSVRGLRLTAAGIVAGFVAAMLLAWAVMRLGSGVADTALPLLPEEMPVPVPALQVDPQQDLATYRAEKLERLTSYGWVSRETGVIHIPIDAAMARVASEGVPRWSAPEAPDPAITAHQARQRALAAPEEDER